MNTTERWPWFRSMENQWFIDCFLTSFHLLVCWRIKTSPSDIAYHSSFTVSWFIAFLFLYIIWIIIFSWYVLRLNTAKKTCPRIMLRALKTPPNLLVLHDQKGATRIGMLNTLFKILSWKDQVIWCMYLAALCWFSARILSFGLDLLHYISSTTTLKMF